MLEAVIIHLADQTAMKQCGSAVDTILVFTQCIVCSGQDTLVSINPA